MNRSDFSPVAALVTFVALASASAALAVPYANTAYSYAVELPAGWVATGAEDANPAEFTGPAGVTARLRLIPRPQTLSPEMAAKLQKSDEVKLFAKYTRSKAIPVQGSLLAALPTTHYGFVYLDEKAEPRVLRFAMASRAAPAGHMWLKAQFSYPRLKHTGAAPAIEEFVRAFRWVERPVVARQAAPPMPPGMGSIPVSAVSEVAGALSASGSLPAVDNASSGPPGEVADADSTYYLSLNQKMSEKDTAAHVETFRGNGEHRSEEEMARARSYGMGDILKPNE